MLISLGEQEVVVFFANTVLPRFLVGGGAGAGKKRLFADGDCALFL